LFALSLLFCLVACEGTPPPANDDDSSTLTLGAVQGLLTTTNSIGRSGSYYLPQREEGEALPVMLVFHFQGGSGEQMIPTFRSLADQERFAIIAPDSRQSPDGQYIWEVGNQPGEVTPDVTHALACLSELTDTLGVVIDEDFVLAAGHSAGGSSAPYIATNNEPFTEFAVLHGGVVQGGIGPRILRGWLSTGENDTIRTPEQTQEAADYLSSLGFGDLTVRTFDAAHSIVEKESQALVQWWLHE